MIIGKCNSRVFIGLAIMGYEPLYHALQIMVNIRVIFWGILIFCLVCHILWAFLVKQQWSNYYSTLAC